MWYSNGGQKTGLKKYCLWSKMSGIRIVCQVMWLYHLHTRHLYITHFWAYYPLLSFLIRANIFWRLHFTRVARSTWLLYNLKLDLLLKTLTHILQYLQRLSCSSYRVQGLKVLLMAVVWTSLMNTSAAIISSVEKKFQQSETVINKWKKASSTFYIGLHRLNA